MTSKLWREQKKRKSDRKRKRHEDDVEKNDEDEEDAITIDPDPQLERLSPDNLARLATWLTVIALGSWAGRCREGT